MSLTKHMRDMWCRFQGELLPEIEDEVGPLLKNHQRFVTVLEVVCPKASSGVSPKKTVAPS